MRFIYRQWRRAATAFSFVVFGIGAFLIGTLLWVVLAPLPLAPSSKRRWARHTIRAAAWLYVRMMWLLGLLSFDFQNKSALLCRGGVFVANHPSLLDVVFLLSVMPGPCCIVKAAMAANPLTRKLVRLAGYISNQGDGQGVLEEAALVVARGESLVIFPEGTRTADPTRLRFRRGAANIALAAGCPVYPVSIEVRPMTLRKGQPWYAVPETRPRFSFTALGAIDAEAVVDTHAPPGIQARQLTRHLQDVLSTIDRRERH